MNIIIPFLIIFPILMGICNYIISKYTKHLRNIIAVSTAITELAIMIFVCFHVPFTYKFWHFTFKIDGFRAILCTIATFMWTMSLLLSNEYMLRYLKHDRYYLANLITLGAILGVFMSNDFITNFSFFELMSFSALILVIHDEKEETLKAGKIYLIVTIISFVLLLTGLIMIYHELKTVDFSYLSSLNLKQINIKTFIGGLLMILGYSSKAGIFPLQFYLERAHVASLTPTSSLLSGILTKSGLFGIIICVTNIFRYSFAMAVILIVLAILSMLIGAIMALFTLNIKKTFACSSMSQMGFILLGVSFLILLEDKSMAFEGLILYIMNHSIVKLILFTITAIIYLNTHSHNLNEVKGFGHQKYLLMICFIIAMLAICGMPLFGGYYAKSLIHEAIIEYGLSLNGFSFFLNKLIEAIFIITGGLTIAYITKIFVYVFIKKNNKTLQKSYDTKMKIMNVSSLIPLVISTLVLLIIGFNFIYANNIFDFIKDLFNISNYKLINCFSFSNILGFIYSLIFGLAIYFIFDKFFLNKKDNKINLKYIDKSK